jgi:hypothetical protein
MRLGIARCARSVGKVWIKADTLALLCTSLLIDDSSYVTHLAADRFIKFCSRLAQAKLQMWQPRSHSDFLGGDRFHQEPSVRSPRLMRPCSCMSLAY